MPMQRDTPRRINPDEAPSWRQGGGKNQCLVGGQITGDGLLVKTVGSYWPDAITLFDFTRRAMTWTAPKSLTNHEVYAVTAHILRLNGKCRSRASPTSMRRSLHSLSCAFAHAVRPRCLTAWAKSRLGPVRDVVSCSRRLCPPYRRLFGQCPFRPA
jgi:hypothetical protein